MDEAEMANFLSSRTRLKIADLVSARPRSLGELAELTGISIQGVLRHLKKLIDLGLVEEVKIAGGRLSVRKVYRAKSHQVGDFSTGDLTVVKLTERREGRTASRDPLRELENLAEESLLRKRRIRDNAKRLGRLIDELEEDQASIRGILNKLDLSEDQRLVLQAVFTEDTIEEGERILTKHYGLEDGRRSIDEALGKATSRAKK